MASSNTYDTLLRVVLFGNAKVGKSTWIQAWENNLGMSSARSGLSGTPSVYKDPFAGVNPTNTYDPTIGVEFAQRVIENTNSHRPTDVKKYKIQAWDTAGERRFESIIKSYIRNAVCAFLCFDVNDRESFDEGIPHYVKMLKEQGYDHTSGQIYVVLVGLKVGENSMKNNKKVAAASATTQKNSNDDDEDESETRLAEVKRLVDEVNAIADDIKNNTNNTISSHNRVVTRQEAEDFAKQNQFLFYSEVSTKGKLNIDEPIQRLANHVHVYGLPSSFNLPPPAPPTPNPNPQPKEKKEKKPKHGFYPTLGQLFYKKKKDSNKNDYETFV